ncbi:hypothetical protein LEP1GSC133_2904 [Leptospira borgpetersenii serovar Pomona str. 200901868]|uniref:Uncharacterized protein n=1 Tax=Leptospira borgpetersenii serovar Pomona str. 200901868 TaxID=1192866 RepID=M6W4G6_LEPBO|nr:hypothetical protein LEP1GSC133_2904 [Leptospira borgpetersenii serovar Pomona str. 200901868]
MDRLKQNGEILHSEIEYAKIGYFIKKYKTYRFEFTFESLKIINYSRFVDKNSLPIRSV